MPTPRLLQIDLLQPRHLLASGPADSRQSLGRYGAAEFRTLRPPFLLRQTQLGKFIRVFVLTSPPGDLVRLLSSILSSSVPIRFSRPPMPDWLLPPPRPRRVVAGKCRAWPYAGQPSTRTSCRGVSRQLQERCEQTRSDRQRVANPVIAALSSIDRKTMNRPSAASTL